MTRQDDVVNKVNRKERHRNHPKTDLNAMCNQILTKDHNQDQEYSPVLDCVDDHDPNYNPDDEINLDELEMPPLRQEKPRRRRISSFGDEPYVCEVTLINI